MSLLFRPIGPTILSYGIFDSLLSNYAQMKRKMLIYILFAVLSTVFSGCTSPFEKVNEFYKEHSIDHTFLGDTLKKEELYLNRTDNMLITHFASIPLDEVSLGYITIKRDTLMHAVLASCNDQTDCVVLSNKGHVKSSGAGFIFFESKDHCLKFIDLLNELRSE
jgi:hypothetical protein